VHEICIIHAGLNVSSARIFYLTLRHYLCIVFVTVFICNTSTVSKGKIIVTGELEGISKKTVVAYFNPACA
jgi:hypothetical protein